MTHVRMSTFAGLAMALPLCLGVFTGCPTKSAADGHSVTPHHLDFGATTLTKTLLVSAGASGGEANFYARSEVPWISVTPKSSTLQAEGKSTVITATVTRALMKPGGNTTTLHITLPGSNEVKIPVRADAIISADFTATPTEVLEGDPVLFNDTSRVLTGADPVSEWCWEFGDGASSSERNPVHVYTTKGRYPVTLTVQSRSLTDTRTRAACVIVKCRAAPKAQFASSTRAPVVGQPVQFVDVSLPGTSPIFQWSWDFGDGAWSALRDPLHIYTAAAVYDVLLTVTTQEGSDTKMKLGLMDVRPAPPVASLDAAE